MEHSIGQAISGEYKLAVVDSNDVIIWEQPEFKKNLILNSGLNRIAVASYASTFTYAVAGTGSRANYFTSSDSKITQTDYNVTLLPGSSGVTNFSASVVGYTTVLQVGDIIKYTVGSGSITEVMVTAVNSSYSATVNTPVQIASPGDTFTIWKTSQSGLQSEIKRTNSYLTGTDWNGDADCSTITSGNTISFRRTYNFTVEASNITYREIATSWQNSYVANNLLNRIVLDSPIEIGPSQRLRLIFKLNVSMYPSTPTYIRNAQISGWPVAPATNTNLTHSVQAWQIGTVGSNGATNESLWSMEPYSNWDGYTNKCVISSVRGIETIGSATNRMGVGSMITVPLSKGTYTQNNFYVYKTAFVDEVSWGLSNIAAICISDSNPYANAQSYAIEFEQTQSKSTLQTLSITFKYAWGRILSA